MLSCDDPTVAGLTRLADVALPVPLPRPLSYSVPDRLAHDVTPGRRVLCTVGSRRLVGVVMGVREAEPPRAVKPLLSVLDGVSLPDDLVAFLGRVASYYLAPIGDVMKLALPPADKETAKAIEAPTLFSEAKGIATRQVQWVTATDAAETGKPSTLLAFVRAHGSLPLSRLEERFGGARATVKRLEGRGLVTVDARDVERDPFFVESITRNAPHDATDRSAPRSTRSTTRSPTTSRTRIAIPDGGRRSSSTA